MNNELSELSIGIDIKKEIYKANLLIVFLAIMLPLIGFSLILFYNTLYIHPKDFQISLDTDSVRVYKLNRLIGATIIGKDGIDSVIRTATK